MSKKSDLGYQVDWEPENKPGERLFWWTAMSLMGLIWWIGFYTTILWVLEFVLG